jgi:hypothetical protein
MSRQDFSNDVQTVKTALIHGREPWKTRNIVGVGTRNDSGGKKISILLQKEAPQELTDYIKNAGLSTQIVTRITGPFQFTSGPGAAILSEGVSGFGTVTAVVKDQHNKRFLLSCYHVLGPVSSTIYDWNTQMPIATTNQVVPWQDQPIPADAALARPISGAELKASFPSSLNLTSTEPFDLHSGDNLAHFGAATTLAAPEGAASHVDEIDHTLIINIRGVPRIFENIALVDDTNFAVPGDSGSLVVNTDKKQPTGIVFAKGVFVDGSGNKKPTAVAVCSLSAALTALGVTLA